MQVLDTSASHRCSAKKLPMPWRSVVLAVAKNAELIADAGTSTGLAVSRLTLREKSKRCARGRGNSRSTRTADRPSMGQQSMSRAGTRADTTPPFFWDGNDSITPCHRPDRAACRGAALVATCLAGTPSTTHCRPRQPLSPSAPLRSPAVAATRGA